MYNLLMLSDQVHERLTVRYHQHAHAHAWLAWDSFNTRINVLNALCITNDSKRDSSNFARYVYTRRTFAGNWIRWYAFT